MTRDNERIYSTALGRNDLGDTRAHTDDHEPDLWFDKTRLPFLNPTVLWAVIQKYKGTIELIENIMISPHNLLELYKATALEEETQTL